jgi:hypothetical protein
VDSKSVAEFVETNLVYRHGTPIRIKVDNGSENKKEVIQAGKRLDSMYSWEPFTTPKAEVM